MTALEFMCVGDTFNYDMWDKGGNHVATWTMEITEVDLATRTIKAVGVSVEMVTKRTFPRERA